MKNPFKFLFKSTSRQSAGNFADIEARNASNMINKGDIILIDIRTKEEYDEKRIKTAININYYSDDFSDEINSLDKSKTYLIYCRSGKRSANAMEIFTSLGFEKVYNLETGIIGWEKENLPVEN